MKAFTKLDARMAPLTMANIDTDQIIPKQFLKTVEREGLGKGLFYDFRFDEQGVEKTDFVLNRPEYKGVGVLVAGDNFGCGSSREHAPWALEQYGFRALIAPSYADIFFNNCCKNGLLPIVLPEVQVATLFDEVAAFVGYTLTVDLERQVVVKPDGAELAFEVEPFRKYCLLNGYDDIGLTLRHADKIRAFESERLLKMPWLAHRL